MTAAVLDACALYPMEMRDTLLRVAAAGAYRLHWSTDILDEMSRNLVDNGVKTEDATAQMQAQMEAAFPDAMVEGYADLIADMPNHKKDRHVAAAAVAAEADVIVTTNLKDFAKLPPRLRALSPDNFLCRVLEAEPDLVLAGLAKQAAVRRSPPMTVDALLDRLSKSLPQFALAVRATMRASG